MDIRPIEKLSADCYLCLNVTEKQSAYLFLCQHGKPAQSLEKYFDKVETASLLAQTRRMRQTMSCVIVEQSGLMVFIPKHGRHGIDRADCAGNQSSLGRQASYRYHVLPGQIFEA